MLCLSCQRPGSTGLCRTCRLWLRNAPERYEPGVGTVRSAYAHQGVARTLVHHLKYRGVIAAGRILAAAMARDVPDGVILVPVPRVMWRHLRYGVDPARELASALGAITGSAVVEGLAPPWLGRARAGGSHGFAPRFRLSKTIPGAVLLVDDVVTTGITLATAAAHFPGVVGAVTATATVKRGRVRPGPHRWPDAQDSEVTSLLGGRTR